MAGLSDLSFDPGVSFSKLVSQRFNCAVSPPAKFSKSSSSLVVSFGRSALRLIEESVALILQPQLEVLLKILLFNTSLDGCTDSRFLAKK
jgi:hypothetical protein